VCRGRGGDGCGGAQSKYDPSNKRHQTIKADIELGNGLPDLNTCEGALAMLKTAGFKVIEEEDLVLTAEIPWYEPLSPNRYVPKLPSPPSLRPRMSAPLLVIAGRPKVVFL